MPENSAEMVDSINAQAPADTEAETTEEIPSAEESSPKTFTADEVDARIKARIDKQNAKHALDMQELRQQIEELTRRSAEVESERDALKHKQDLTEWANDAADKYGVPASILRGNCAEDFMEHAKAIKASIAVVPDFRDSGEPKEPPKSGQAIFNEFMKNNFQ